MAHRALEGEDDKLKLTRGILAFLTSALAIGVIVACGDDSSDEKPAGGTGGGGAGGSSGAGGSAGASGGSAGASGGSAGASGAGGAASGGTGGLTGCSTTPAPVVGASGKIINVTLTGNDTTGDGSTNQPLRTLKKACDLAQPGDRIELGGGNWKTTGEKCSATGSAAAPVHIVPRKGESVVFDATGAALGPTDSAVFISGNYIVFDGFEVKGSSGRGVSYYQATGVTLRNLVVHEIAFRSLGGSGKDIVIENNEVYNAALSNENGKFGSGGWPGVIQNALYSDGTPSKNVVVRNNHVHDAWGECIIAGAVDGSRIEGNRVHDCFSVNIYVDAGVNVSIERNQLYATTAKYDRPDNGARAAGINIATESGSIAQMVNNLLIANNIVTETSKGISYWHDASNTSATNTWQKIGIFHNVIAHTLAAAVSIDAVVAAPAPTGGSIENNVIWAGAKGGALVLGNPAAWQISNNVWPDGKPVLDPSAQSLAGDPGLSAPTTAAQPDGFKLLASSIASGAGKPLPEVKLDFWCSARSATAPSIGVHEP